MSAMTESAADRKRLELERVMEQACTLEDDAPLSDDAQLERWAAKAVDILMLESDVRRDTGKGNRVNQVGFEKIEQSFNACNDKLVKLEKDKEFQIVEDFVVLEKRRGRRRRERSRLTEAAQEIRMAAEIAALQEFRSASKSTDGRQLLQAKISDAERAYSNRVKVHAKAAQQASAECREQFSRVRAFFEELHQSRLGSLNRQERRNLQLQAVTHRLRRTDNRVVALEQQMAKRIFHKKRTDINELHMAQHLEESSYLDKMMDLLDGVQCAKEKAAEELFSLQINHLKNQRSNNDRRDEELNDINAASKVEMAQLVAHYVKEDNTNNEADDERKEQVGSTERSKNYHASSNSLILSVSQLYDTVMWSVAMNKVGLSSSGGSSLYSSELDSDEGDEEEEEGNNNNNNNVNVVENDPRGGGDDNSVLSYHKGGVDVETGSSHSASTANSAFTADDETRVESSVGKMHVKKIAREVRKKRRELVRKHEEESKREHRNYRAAARVLRKKHQTIIDDLLANCVRERHQLREVISQRMAALEKSQMASSTSFRQDVVRDVSAMQDAWTEHRRLEDAEKSSFAKAQALISAQVFHEVRNALSSVISMSEITSSLKRDTTITPKGLMSSVDEMLDQIKEVVHYALNMLNNILDVSKMNSGTFDVDRKLFDLQDLVNRATKMQLVKAKSRRIHMAYVPSPGTLVAHTDNDIVVRIVTNFISNAVKFTSCGGVQPFVWPVESLLLKRESDESRAATTRTRTNDDVDADDDDDGEQNDGSSLHQLVDDWNAWKTEHERHLAAAKTSSSSSSTPSSFVADESSMRMVMVGVADSGPGLKRKLLKKAEDGLSNSDSKSAINSGAKNSGFGLHLAHQLAKALDTKVYLLSLRQCGNLLSDDMRRVANERRQKNRRSDDSMSDATVSTTTVSTTSADDRSEKRIPGAGTVLCIMIPVFVDGAGASEALVESRNVVATNAVVPRAGGRDNVAERYVFAPKPAPGVATFRILVADDVFMLRKGLVHTLIDVFSRYADCPVTICSACSAEDVLRAVAYEPFDLIICDNQFAEPSALRPLAEGDEGRRPRLYYKEEGSSMTKTDPSAGDTAVVVPKRKVISKFFSEERFAIEEGDGSLSGVDALMEIGSAAENPDSRLPLLILLSGHKIQFPAQKNYNIIVVQKPLKQAEFVPLLESHAHSLLKAGQVKEVVNESNNAENDNDNDGEGEGGKTTTTSDIMGQYGGRFFTKEIVFLGDETEADE